MAHGDGPRFQWEAPEFKEYSKSIGWYTLLVVGMFLLALYQVFISDYFGAICTVIIGVLVGVLSRRKPQIVTVALDNDGVTLGETHIPYRHFQHFWIVDTPDHKTLNLEASTYFKQTIIIELVDQDPEKIRRFVGRHIVEAENALPSFSQRIAHKLKF